MQFFLPRTEKRACIAHAQSRFHAAQAREEIFRLVLTLVYGTAEIHILIGDHAIADILTSDYLLYHLSGVVAVFGETSSEREERDRIRYGRIARYAQLFTELAA